MPTSVRSFATDEIKVRFQEPLVSEGLNRKAAVTTPHGTYRGFRLVTNGATSQTVTVVADLTALDHVVVAQVGAALDRFSLMIRKTGGNFDLNLNALAGLTVVLAITGSYVTGTVTSAEITAFTIAEYNALTASDLDKIVVLGTVIVPAAAIPIPPGDVGHDRRNEAWTRVAPHANPWAPLLRNPGFEWGETAETSKFASAFWETETTVGSFVWRPVTTEANTGAKSLEINVTVVGAITGRAVQIVNAPIVAGQFVIVQFYKKVLATTVGGALDLALTWTDLDGNVLATTTTPISTALVDASFVKIEQFAPIPANARHLRSVAFRATALDFGASTAAVVRLDDIQCWLETATPLALYPFDGRVPHAEEVSSLIVRPSEAAFNSLAALFTFDPTTPVNEGRIVVERRDQNSALLPPALRWRGRVVLGDGLLATETDALKPRIAAAAATGGGIDFTLMWESAPAAQQGTRIYMEPTGGLVFTINASWGGLSWSKDIADGATAASKFRFVNGSLTVLRRAPSADVPWSDATWSSTPMTLDLASELALAVGSKKKRTATAVSYVVLLDDEIIGITNTAAPRTMTLPTVASAGVGKIYTFKDESGTASAVNFVRLDPNGAELIDGVANVDITVPYGAARVYCSGAAWFTI